MVKFSMNLIISFSFIFREKDLASGAEVMEMLKGIKGTIFYSVDDGCRVANLAPHDRILSFIHKVQGSWFQKRFADNPIPGITLAWFYLALCNSLFG